MEILENRKFLTRQNWSMNVRCEHCHSLLLIVFDDLIRESDNYRCQCAACGYFLYIDIYDIPLSVRMN